MPRPCVHAASAVPDEKCTVCLRWAEYPEFYCLFEGLDYKPTPPDDVVAARRLHPTAWRDPERVREIARAFGTTVPEGELRADHELPGLGTRIANFGMALARHVAGGLKHTPPEVVEKRRGACNGCERKTPDDRCAACGGNIGTKIAWNEEACPLGKWPA